MSCAGLAPVVALAQRCGLAELVAGRLTVPGAGVNAQMKVPAVVAGMVAGADSIEDLDLLRHGGMSRLFDDVRAPSTLGTFLRAFTFGHEVVPVLVEVEVAVPRLTPVGVGRPPSQPDRTGDRCEQDLPEEDRVGE